MKNRVRPSKWFLDFLDDLSNIFTRHIHVDKDSINKTKLDKLINQFKQKLNQQMNWKAISQLEDDFFATLLKTFPDYLDVTGLFGKIEFEMERKQAIINKLNKDSSDKALNNQNCEIIISHRIQEYIEKNTVKINNVLIYLENKKIGKGQDQEQYKDAILHISWAYYKRGKMNLIDIIKEIPNIFNRIELLNYILFEDSPLAKLLKPPFFENLEELKVQSVNSG